MSLKTFLHPYSAIIFLRDYKLGFFLLIISFLLPSVGFFGVVGLLATIVFTKLIGLKEDKLIYNFYLYNSLLVGMGVGYFFDVSLNTFILTITLSIFTFLLSYSLKIIFSYYNLPILSLPFSFVSIIFYLASLKYTNLLSNILNRHPIFDITLPFSNFFKSVGTIFFLPYNIAGVVILIIILFYSRIMFFLGVVGYLIGVYFHSFFIPLNEAINNIYNFNFIIIAIALGGVFLIPSIKSYLIAIIGVILSVIIIDAMEVFFNIYSLPVYTIPFNIIVLMFLMFLYWSGYKYYNFYIKATPEKSLSFYLSNILRFGGNNIKIYLPFYGKWSVYQAFDGEWTHKGKWRYAYDFVIKQNNKTYKNEGLFLEDYYAFGKDVISPVNGYIVDLRADLADNFIGSVDRENNWGNYVIIKSGNIYVEISHLMQYSIPFKIGDYVKVGDIIGKCGNSGYSPEPHIHIQVQKFPYLGSETLPFKFVEYIKENRLFYYKLPKLNEEIEHLPINKADRLKVTFILEDKFEYEVYKNDKKIDKVSFEVRMNENGEFYFFDGKNRLYFAMAEKFFYFYNYEGNESYLKLLFLLAPKIPFINKTVEFEEYLPLDIEFKGVKLSLIEFIASFKNIHKKSIYKKDNLSLKSKFGEVKFSFYEKGFDTIVYKNLKLKRIK